MLLGPGGVKGHRKNGDVLTTALAAPPRLGATCLRHANVNGHPRPGLGRWAGTALRGVANLAPVTSNRQDSRSRRVPSLRPAAAAGGSALSRQPGGSPAAPTEDPITEIARQNLRRAALVCRRFGWMAFWVQLVLTTVASVIVLFSLAFTSQNGPQVSLYLTLFGIIMGFLSTFWSFGYTRLSRRLVRFLEAAGSAEVPRIRRSDVINMLEKGAIINVFGAGASMLGLQATIGLLVAKTLTTATVNPFLASSTTNWNPVLAFDVFNVQATTNALLAHFFSLVVSLYLLRTIANRPAAANVVAKAAPA